MYNPFEDTIPEKKKIQFATGAFGSGMMFTLISAYLMFFLTQVQGLSGAVVGTFFMVARLWDAVNDPMIGGLVCNTRSRFGKNRVWIIGGTIFTTIATFLLFLDMGHLAINQRYAFYLIIYMLWGTATTMVDIPFWSIIPAMTRNEKERESISSHIQIASTLATAIFTVASPFLLNGVFSSSEEAYFVLATAVSAIFCVTMLVTGFTSQEKRTMAEKVYTPKAMFKAFISNKQAIALFVPIVLLGIAFNLTIGLGLYFFAFDIGSFSQYSLFMVVAGLAMAIAVLKYSKFVKKTSKKTVFTIACITMFLGYSAMFVLNQLHHGNFLLLAIGGVIALMGYGWYNVARPVMISTLCDYSFKKTKQRMDSLWVSIYSFAGKVGSALTALIVGLVLDIGKITGIDPATPNVVVPEEGITAIRIAMFIVPAVLVIITLFLYLKFIIIDNKKTIFRFSASKPNPNPQPKKSPLVLASAKKTAQKKQKQPSRTKRKA